MNENIYNTFIDKGLISLTYQKLKQIRKKREENNRKMGKGHEQSDGRQREKNKPPIYLKCHTISLIKLKMKKDFFPTDQQKKKKSLLTLVLLRVWGKTLVWIGAMCIKKNTVLLGTYPARKHPRKLSISTDSLSRAAQQTKCILYNHDEGWHAPVCAEMERPITRPGKQDTEEWVWHACFSVNKPLNHKLLHVQNIFLGEQKEIWYNGFPWK